MTNEPGLAQSMMGRHEKFWYMGNENRTLGRA